MTIQVSAPTRLHFGLLHVPTPGEAPTFGGLGAMLDAPRVEVEAVESDDWRFEGLLAARARTFVELIALKIPIEKKMRIRADGPPEHTGLGVGTALGLSIATVLTSPQRLPGHLAATLAGRGERSQIGIRGFATGGFLLDDGPRSRRLDFPDEWRFALLTVSNSTPWHGDRERAAFARPRTRDLVEAATKKLRSILDHDLLPALAARDFPRFAAALAAYNRTAGGPFAEDQGGTFASPEVAATIRQLEIEIFPGAGQSSWGPTVYVPIPDELSAGRLLTHYPCACVSKVDQIGTIIAPKPVDSCAEKPP